jgi:hypothetical protein
MGKPEGKRPQGEPRLKWEGNIKMGLRKIWQGELGYIDLTQVRDQWRALVNTVMKLRVM